MDGNSITEKREKAKEESLKPTCIVKGQVKTQEKTFGSKVKDFFIGDTGKDFASTIWEDIIKPGVTDVIYDMIVGAASGLCYKDFGGRRKKNKSGSGSFYDYTNNSGSKKKERPSDRRRGMFDLEEVFDDKVDAQDVLNALQERIERFNVTTVGDYYDFIGKTAPGNYTTADWGWYDLDDVVVRHRNDGWVIDLPKPKHLD